MKQEVSVEFLGDLWEVEAWRTMQKLNELRGKLSYSFSSVRFGNMSMKYKKKDSPGSEELVIESRKRFAKAAGIDLSNLVEMNPVHGKNILVVGFDDIGKNIAGADALITFEKDLELVLYPADCTPLIITNRNADFVALVHAGRTGTDLQIAKATVEKLQEMGLTQTKDFVAGLGPAVECYTLNYLATDNPEAWLDFVNVPLESGAGIRVIETPADKTKYKIVTDDPRQKLFVDIAGFNVKQLVDAGVPVGNIDRSNICTVCNTLEGRLYSHGVTLIDEDAFPESRFMACVKLNP